MSPAALVDDLQSKGFKLTVDGGKLAIDAPRGTIGPDLLEALAANKAAILAILATETVVEPETHATREWRRFMAAAKPWTGGRCGWYAPVEMARLAPTTGPEDHQPEEIEETACLRAAKAREAWERDGYPPGIRPRKLTGGDDDGTRLANGTQRNAT